MGARQLDGRQRLGDAGEGPVEAVERPAGVGERALRSRRVRGGKEEADVDEGIGGAGEDQGRGGLGWGLTVLVRVRSDCGQQKGRLKEENRAIRNGAWCFSRNWDVEGGK